MPTNRRYRTRSRSETIDPVHWAILNDAPLPDDANPFALLDGNDYKAMLPLWMEHRKEVLADWIAANPGTRPSLGWRYEAPRLDASALGRWSRTVMAPRLIKLRRKLRGEGQPLHEVLNYVPAHDFGIPAWCGNPADPPTFEPQRTYLKRHGLLLTADRRPIAEPVPHPLRIEPFARWKWASHTASSQ